MYIDNRMDSLASLKSIKRHYKKDSRYVNDLYTLTYDNHESLEDTVELISSLYFRTDLAADERTSDSQKYLGASEQLIRNANLQHRLAQARLSAIKQFEFEKNRQGVSLMTNFMRQTLAKVNREKHAKTAEGFTAELLQTMNVTQLQIIVNEILDFRGVLNEALMMCLVERDDLLSKRDALMQRIEKASVCAE